MSGVGGGNKSSVIEETSELTLHVAKELRTKREGGREREGGERGEREREREGGRERERGGGEREVREARRDKRR